MSLASIWLVLVAGAGTEFDVQPRSEDWGQRLLADYGCIACHAPEIGMFERVGGRIDAPTLQSVGSRVSPVWLRQFLAQPNGALPGTRMPHVLASVEHEERRLLIEDLVQFLATLGGPHESERVAAAPERVEAGRQLFHEVGCVACHAPRETVEQLEWPFWESSGNPQPLVDGGPSHSLPDLRSKYGVAALTEFLLDPLAARPSGRMPSMRLSEREAQAIALYLCADELLSGEAQKTIAPGLTFEAYEGDFGEKMPDFELVEPVRRGVITDLAELPEHRDEEFAFVFRGLLEVPLSGTYVLALESDDGSRLWLDGELQIDNDGDHAAQEVESELFLDAGRHPLRIEYFNNKGDWAFGVSWSGPDFEAREIDAEHLGHEAFVFETPGDAVWKPDRAAARRGREHFQRFGCTRCHDLDEAPPDIAPSAPSLAQLEGVDDGRGCLSPQPSQGRPSYALGALEREAIVLALADSADLGRPLSHDRAVQRHLQRLGCVSCHARGGVGGPARERRSYFKTSGEAELGDEGRIPPQLEGVGGKLQPGWLSRVLLEGGTSRPYMVTRMPEFGVPNVDALVTLFPVLDRPPREAERREPLFDLEHVELGRRLAGQRGLGCIQCHSFAGHDSLGIPAADLAEVTSRLTYNWFHTLLSDPASINMNTRMPKFWLDGESPVMDILDGDPERQTQALWTYLSLGHSCPLPDGLVAEPGEHEIVVQDEPRLVGVFMEGVSPRTVAVGFPQRLHYAFDVQASRLAKAWRGDFFDAAGTWVGRAGRLEQPPSSDVLDFAPGVPFALLARETTAWPEVEDASEAGYRVLGRRFDSERRPIFRYALGEVTIEETPAPRLGTGGGHLVRQFRLRAPTEVRDLWLRAAVGQDGVESGPGEFELDGEQTVWVRAAEQSKLRPSDEGVEVLARVGPWRQVAGGFEAELEVEMEW